MLSTKLHERYATILDSTVSVRKEDAKENRVQPALSAWTQKYSSDVNTTRPVQTDCPNDPVVGYILNVCFSIRYCSSGAFLVRGWDQCFGIVDESDDHVRLL